VFLTKNCCYFIPTATFACGLLKPVTGFILIPKLPSLICGHISGQVIYPTAVKNPAERSFILLPETLWIYMVGFIISYLFT